MGKPTKKNIRRKNRRTRRKVNKKKMKKGGVSFDLGINTGIGKCNGIMGKETSIISKYNKEDITTGTFLDNDDNTATLKKICQDKTNPNTITFLINVGPLQNKRMTSDAFKDKYIYYKPLNEDKFKYDINGDTLSKKTIISNMKKPFSSMFSFFGKKNK